MTTVVVSHDSSFLDKVCTHVINVKQRKSESGSYAEFFSRRCALEVFGVSIRL